MENTPFWRLRLASDPIKASNSLGRLPKEMIGLCWNLGVAENSDVSELTEDW